MTKFVVLCNIPSQSRCARQLPQGGALERLPQSAHPSLWPSRHGHGRSTPDSPRTVGVAADFLLLQITNRFRLIQTVPGQSLTPRDAQLTHKSPEFQTNQASPIIKIIPMTDVMGNLRFFDSLRSLRMTGNQAGAGYPLSVTAPPSPCHLSRWARLGAALRWGALPSCQETIPDALCTKRDPAPCWPPSLPTFLAEQESRGEGFTAGNRTPHTAGS